MKISDLIAKGSLPYLYVYMQTMTGCKTAQHVRKVPAALAKIASSNPNATLVRYGDGSRGIADGAEILAVELPDPDMRRGRTLPPAAWHYLAIASGDDPNKYARR